MGPLDTSDTAAHTRADLEHDLARLIDNGKDAVEVVSYSDVRFTGGPLALSASVRERIFHLVLRDLSRQLEQRRLAVA